MCVQKLLMKLKRWQQDLESATIILQTKEEAKVPMLLHYLGTENFSFFCDFMDDKDLLKESYKILVEMCKELFDPKIIEIAEV